MRLWKGAASTRVGGSEVLPIVRNGEPDRTIARTFKLLIQLGLSGQGNPYSASVL